MLKKNFQRIPNRPYRHFAEMVSAEMHKHSRMPFKIASSCTTCVDGLICRFVIFTSYNRCSVNKTQMFYKYDSMTGLACRHVITLLYITAHDV